jgi:hypothetical protein
MNKTHFTLNYSSYIEIINIYIKNIYLYLSKLYIQALYSSFIFKLYIQDKDNHPLIHP